MPPATRCKLWFSYEFRLPCWFADALWRWCFGIFLDGLGPPQIQIFQAAARERSEEAGDSRYFCHTAGTKVCSILYVPVATECVWEVLEKPQPKASVSFQGFAADLRRSGSQITPLDGHGSAFFSCLRLQGQSFLVCSFATPVLH